MRMPEAPDDGIVNPGTFSGASATASASATSSTATLRFASGFHGSKLLDRNERSHEDHPADAHGAEREERGHQCPAAADAPGAVEKAHDERSVASTPPLLGQEGERRAAAAQAGVLRRRELIGGRGQDHPGGEEASGALPAQGTDGQGLHGGEQT